MDAKVPTAQIKRSSLLVRALRGLLTLTLVAAVAATVIWGFIESREEWAREVERDQPIKPPQRVSLEGEEPVITLDPSEQERSGLRIVALEPSNYHEELRAYASILDPQPLVDLSSSYWQATAQLAGAQAKLDASKAELERYQGLFKSKSPGISVTRLRAVEASHQADQAALAAARAQLRAIEETAAHSWGPVLGRKLSEDNPALTRLIERQDYLVQVTLPPSLSVTKPPATGLIVLNDGTRRPIEFISPMTKTHTSLQGMSFLYRSPASDDLLPGMNVLALLPLDRTMDGVAVPAEAIVWWQGRAWTYVQTSPTTFTRRTVPTDHPLPDGGYFVDTLAEGTKVVSEGAQLLLSEEFRAQIQLGEDAE